MDNERTKSQKKPKEKIGIKSSNNAIIFENFIKRNYKAKSENKSKEKKERAKSKSKANKNIETEENKIKKINNKKIIDDFLKRNVPKNKKENKKEKNVSPKKINIKKKNLNLSPKIMDFNSFKQNNQTNSLNKDKRNNSYERNKSASVQKNKIIKDKNVNNIKVKDTGVPLGVIEAEINSGVKSINLGQNIPKRFSPIKDNLIKYDNSKYEKYDIQQIKYELMKDYSNIQPKTGEGFLQRMQFDTLKRKNKDEKINELLEKNKPKINKEEGEKAFKRLIEDANRRQNEKKGKELLEDESNIIKDEYNIDSKKYNEEEWNEIYNKRFREYEEYKKKRMEIKREKEKIEKMIEEQEEIDKHTYYIKKLPEYKIQENAQRLYDDAKKREIIRNRKIAKNKNNNNITSFNDEEDVSKYMKSYKSEVYNFNGSSENNSNFLNQNEHYFNLNEYKNNNAINLNNLYGEYEAKKYAIPKYNKVNMKSFNNNSKNKTRKFNTRNNTKKKNKKNYYQFNDNINQNTNFTYNNSNNKPF